MIVRVRLRLLSGVWPWLLLVLIQAREFNVADDVGTVTFDALFSTVEIELRIRMYLMRRPAADFCIHTYIIIRIIILLHIHL
jgi:hypothetical protein